MELLSNAQQQVPSLPPLGSKPIEAVFDHFVGQGYDEHEQLMVKVRWFAYGPREDSWHYVEDLPAENVRKHCMQHRLTVRRRVSNNYVAVLSTTTLIRRPAEVTS